MGSITFQDFSDVEKFAEDALKTGQYFDEQEYNCVYYFNTNGDKKLTYDQSIKFENENSNQI